jgi:hypothetical protein
MTLYTEEEVREWTKKALPADDFSNAKWEYRGDGLYYVSGIEDNMGKERKVYIRNRDRRGDPPAITDADTGERYWPDVK